jgi:hypothetical protein
MQDIGPFLWSGLKLSKCVIISRASTDTTLLFCPRSKIVAKLCNVLRYGMERKTLLEERLAEVEKQIIDVAAISRANRKSCKNWNVLSGIPAQQSTG